MGAGQKVLEVRHLSKRFPGVQALRGVSFALGEGEVVGLVGENGAGKSTLVKILAGIYRPDEGEILVEGRTVSFHHPREAARCGLAFVHQQLNLVPFFDAVDNVFLGRWVSHRGGLLDRKAMREVVQRLCREFGFPLSLTTPARDLSVSERCMLQIIRAFLEKPRVLVLDEPTAALPEEEVETVLRMVRQVALQGVAVLYVSHRLGEIFSICHRVVVLRNGEKVFEGALDSLSPEDLIAQMVGTKRAFESSALLFPVGEKILEVQSLSDGRKLQDVSFSLARGEILGIYGLQGAGRTELLEVLFGVRRYTRGRVFLYGRPFAPASPEEAIRAGVALVPEDRGAKGLILRSSLFENAALPHLQEYRRFMGYFEEKRFKPLLEKVLELLRTRYHSLSDPVQLLSGGNQQKVVLAKWLLRDFGLFLLDEPTTGVDVGTRRELYRFIRKLAQEGKGVIVTSSDLEEILEITPHRVMVLREGRVAGILEGVEIEKKKILQLCYQGG